MLKTNEKSWSAPAKPAEITYNRLIEAIMDGSFPPHSQLPAERQLADRLGVTRSTLREALQRLAANGWIEINQGKPTRVRDIWIEGNLNTLAALIDHPALLPTAFVPQILEVRLALAPAYAKAAVTHNQKSVIDLLQGLRQELADTPDTFATVDWQLHHQLTILSMNPVYTLILNGFEGFYERMARLYFALAESRQSSRQFYADLHQTAVSGDALQAQKIVRQVMQYSITLWAQAMPTIDPGG